MPQRRAPSKNFPRFAPLTGGWVHAALPLNGRRSVGAGGRALAELRGSSLRSQVGPEPRHLFGPHFRGKAMRRLGVNAAPEGVGGAADAPRLGGGSLDGADARDR